MLGTATSEDTDSDIRDSYVRKFAEGCSESFARNAGNRDAAAPDPSELGPIDSLANSAIEVWIPPAPSGLESAEIIKQSLPDAKVRYMRYLLESLFFLPLPIH